MAERLLDAKLHRIVTRASRGVVDQAHAGELRVGKEQLPARHSALRQGPCIDDSEKWVVDQLLKTASKRQVPRRQRVEFTGLVEMRSLESDVGNIQEEA